MKKTQSLMFVLAVAITLLAFGTVALAADTAAKDPAKCAAEKAEKKCDADKKAPEGKKHAAAKEGKKAPEGPKCIVKGTIEAKTVKDKKGQEVKVYLIKVAEAKDADGKVVDSLTGKKLRIAGLKPQAAEELVGKETELKGIVVNGKRLVVKRAK